MKELKLPFMQFKKLEVPEEDRRGMMNITENWFELNFDPFIRVGCNIIIGNETKVAVSDVTTDLEPWLEHVQELVGRMTNVYYRIHTRSTGNDNTIQGRVIVIPMSQFKDIVFGILLFAAGLGNTYENAYHKAVTTMLDHRPEPKENLSKTFEDYGLELSTIFSTIILDSVESNISYDSVTRFVWEAFSYLASSYPFGGFTEPARDAYNSMANSAIAIQHMFISPKKEKTED